MKLYEVKWSYMKLYEVIWSYMLDPCQKATEKKRKQNGAPGPGAALSLDCHWMDRHSLEFWELHRRLGQCFEAARRAGRSWWQLVGDDFSATNGDFFTQHAGRMVENGDIWCFHWNMDRTVGGLPFMKTCRKLEKSIRGPLAAPNWLRHQADEIPGS